MTTPDPIMEELGAGILLAQRGERVKAASLFASLWERVGSTGDPLHRCAISHWMADVQDELQNELRWDLRALEAAREVTEERATQGGLVNPVEVLYPSLHLNLGEVYRKLGEPELAAHHLAEGQKAAEALPDDGYGTMIRNGLRGLLERIADPPPTSP